MQLTVVSLPLMLGHLTVAAVLLLLQLQCFISTSIKMSIFVGLQYFISVKISFYIILQTINAFTIEPP